MPQAPLQALEIQAKSLRFIADRLGEISAALSAPPSRDTFPVFLEQANRLALMLDLVMGRTPADAPHPLEYRDVFGWDFGVFAADWDAFTKPGGTGFSFYEHDWISAGEAATQTPEVADGHGSGHPDRAAFGQQSLIFKQICQLGGEIPLAYQYPAPAV